MDCNLFDLWPFETDYFCRCPLCNNNLITLLSWFTILHILLSTLNTAWIQMTYARVVLYCVMPFTDFVFRDEGN